MPHFSDYNKKNKKIPRLGDFKVQGTDGWTKTYYEQSESGKAGTVEFKCLDAEIFHQIIKHYNGETITENDLVFYHNGQLARFLKEVNNPWE